LYRPTPIGALVLLVATTMVLVVAGCGGSDESTSSHPLRAAGSEHVLKQLLTSHGVKLDGSAGSLQSAWEAFKQFAEIPVSVNDVVASGEGDGFILQWGTYPRERRFQLDFTRQYVLRTEDIQQVHLVLNFPNTVGGKAGNGAWSFDLPGAGRRERLAAWTSDVESSVIYQALIAADARPESYDVWQESAE
jgi:hypothetical protein